MHSLLKLYFPRSENEIENRKDYQAEMGLKMTLKNEKALSPNSWLALGSP